MGEQHARIERQNASEWIPRAKMPIAKSNDAESTPHAHLVLYRLLNPQTVYVSGVLVI